MLSARARHPFFHCRSLPVHSRFLNSIDNRRLDIARQLKVDVLSKDPCADNAVQTGEISRSFISDTVTAPTKDMYAYAVQASLGDDVYFDPSTKALEDHIARLTGKEAALFVPSGTMSNQLAIRAHLKQPPFSVLVDHRSHMNMYETGGAAFHSGATLQAVRPANRHHLTLSDVEASVEIGTDVHIAPTELIVIENTLNGLIVPQSDVIAIAEFAHSHGMKTHLDGARIWHVAAETAVPLRELCDPFDSVNLCFSKGLGAPVGSCLSGTNELIARARRLRKLFGGGMRQTGILAGCAAYALTHNFPLLPAVHILTRRLERGLKEVGVDIISPAETCMFFYDPSPLGLSFEDIANRAGQLPEPLTLSGSRVVVHIQTTHQAVDDFIAVVLQLAEEKKRAGFVRANVKRNDSGNVFIYGGR